MLFILIATTLWNGVLATEEDSWESEMDPYYIWQMEQGIIGGPSTFLDDFDCGQGFLWENTATFGDVYYMSFEECKEKFKGKVAGFMYKSGLNYCQAKTVGLGLESPVIYLESSSGWTYCEVRAEKPTVDGNIVPGDWLTGWCEESAGVDVNEGTVELGVDFNLDTCLAQCSRRFYTACEWDTNIKKCVRHTKKVRSASGHKQHRCYVTKEEQVAPVVVEKRKVQMTKYYVSDAGNPHRFQVSKGTACCGWTDRLSFYAFPEKVEESTAYYVSEAHNPHRFQVSKSPACCGWTDVFTFYAFGHESFHRERFYVSEAHNPHRFQVSKDPPCCGWTEVFSFWASDKRNAAAPVMEGEMMSENQRLKLANKALREALQELTQE